MECSGLERQANWNQVWGLEERTQDVAHLLKKRVIYSVCPPALPSPLPPQCSDLSNVVQIETYSITYALAWIWQRLSELWWKEALKVKVKFLEPLELLPATPQKKKKRTISAVLSVMLLSWSTYLGHVAKLTAANIRHCSNCYCHGDWSWHWPLRRV